MSWTRLTLQVRTPLFGGDDPRNDHGTPIRVPAIRGALRFWFRAVAAGHGVSDLDQLWNAEQAVFGSADTPSEIKLRISGQPTASGRGSKPDWAITEQRANRPGFDGAQYLLGQGLWNYQAGLRRGFVHGESIELGIRFSRDEQVNARFMLALWAWLTYGGLGARTRRGFGQLVCTGVGGELRCGWTHAALLPPRDADGWAALGECAIPGSLPGRDALGWGALLPAPPSNAEQVPEIPALTPRWWSGKLLTERAGSLGEALHLAGLRWRRFRAADGSDNLPLRRKPSPSTRSPEWTNVIHGTDNEYPIAAFGLPVGYFSQSRGPIFKTTVTPKLDGTELRRASPVWLRPVLLAGDRWGVFTHLFYARLLPDGAKLHIEGGRQLPPPPGNVVEDAWDRWILPHSAGNYSPRR
ncbi:MAG: type III-B CRISPR module RAMP protein Cmr1 [Pseudonocardiaceae bacterium]